jgi:4-carboxymuconolactone decarboxylase
MENSNERLPKRYKQFLEKYPEIAKCYNELGDAVHQWGPLDDRSRALVKLAISGSTLQKSAFKSHIRKAIALGISRKEIEHVAFLTLPTMGFSTTMTLLSFIDEQMNSEGQ